MPISKMTVMSHGDSVVIYKKTASEGILPFRSRLITDRTRFPELRNPSDFPRIR